MPRNLRKFTSSPSIFAKSCRSLSAEACRCVLALYMLNDFSISRRKFFHAPVCTCALRVLSQATGRFRLVRSRLFVSKGGMLACTRISTLLNAVCSFLLAVLLAVQVAAAFLPVSSNAGKSGAALTGLICTAEGMRTITLPDAAGSGTSSDDAALHGHCPLCILAADLPGSANHVTSVGEIETRLHVQFVAASQTPVQFGGRPDAIRAPPHSA